MSAKREKSRLEAQKVVSDGEFELPQSAVQLEDVAMATTIVPSVASSVETNTQIKDSEAAENLAFLATYVTIAQDQATRDENTFAHPGSDFESSHPSGNRGGEFLDDPLGNGTSGTPENMSSEIVAVAEVMSFVQDHEISVEISPAMEWREEEKGTEITVVMGGRRRGKHGRSVRRAEKMAAVPVSEEEGGGGGGGGGGESYLGGGVGVVEELGRVKRSRRKVTQVRRVASEETMTKISAQKSMSESPKRSTAIKRSPKTQRERAQRRREGAREQEGVASPPTKRRSHRAQRSLQLKKPEGEEGGGGESGGGGGGGGGGGRGGGGGEEEEEETWREGCRPSLWGVEEVVKFVASIPQCTFCTEVFRDHVSADVWRISGIECVCQKIARLRVFTASAKFLRALI